MNRQLLLCCLAPAFFTIAGCSKSPQEMDCNDMEVQTNVRKLLTMKIQDWQQPLQPGLMMEKEYMQSSNPELSASLNGLRARGMSPEKVRLTEIEQVSAPEEPLQDADPKVPSGGLPGMYGSKSTGNKLLYQCAAKAHIKIGKDIIGALPPDTRTALGLDDEGLNASVLYQTELTKDEGLWVAAGFAHPLAEVSIRALFSRLAAATTQ